MGFMANFKGRRAYSTHIRGNQAIDKGDIAKAAELHRQALRLYSEAYEAGCRDVNVVMAYGVLLMRFGEYEKARDLLLSCEHMPGLDAKSKKQLRINYSVCQWRLGNLDRAIELMEESASNGKTAMIYTTLGYYYIERGIQTGDFAQAIAFNQEAYEYDEEDAGVLDNLGQLYYAMGETDKAYDYFKRAFEQKPSQVPTLYFIAKMNHEKGDDEKARGFIKKCLEGNFSALCSISREQALALADEIG